MINSWRRWIGVFALLLFLFQLPLKVGAEEKNSLEDEIVYSIVVDRFYNGDTQNDTKVNIHDENAYQGGDIKGIIKKLDYIKEMGFTAIMVTPLVDSNHYDGYSPTGITKINSQFGTINDAKQLVSEAHKRDMKVIFEFVIQEEESILNRAVWLVKETDVDGFYVRDTDDVSDDFIHTMIERVQSVKGDFVFIGEPNSEKGQVVFNDKYYEQITNVFAKPNVSIKPLYDETSRNEERLQAVFLDNNETKRFVRTVKENKHYPPTRLKLALTYLYTSQSIPFVYYGTEIALDGGDVPDNRRLMDFKTDEDFLHYITTLGEIRKSRPSLRRGEAELLYDQSGMSVIKRTYKDETSLVVINNTTETQKISLSANEFGSDRELRGLIEEEIIRETEGKYHLVVDRETANIYAVGEKTGLNWLFITVIVGMNIAFIIFLIAVKKRKRSSDLK